MELMDVFGKTDTIVDASCKRHERLYFEMCKELSKPEVLMMEVSVGRRGEMKKATVEEYIKEF
jgi:hypothetical protein